MHTFALTLAAMLMNVAPIPVLMVVNALMARTHTTAPVVVVSKAIIAMKLVCVT
jgi:hypothetical protein